MIIELLFKALAGIVNFFLKLFPPLPDISGLTGTLSGAANTLSSYAATTGSWIPWGTIQTCVTLILSMLAAAVVIKFVRIVASFFTAGGGSAA